MPMIKEVEPIAEGITLTIKAMNGTKQSLNLKTKKSLNKNS